MARSAWLCALLCALLGVSASAEAAEARRVSLDLFYEALCPYCASFVAVQLNHTLDQGFADIVDLRFVPWVRWSAGSAGCMRLNTRVRLAGCSHGSRARQTPQLLMS